MDWRCLQDIFSISISSLSRLLVFKDQTLSQVWQETGNHFPKLQMIHISPYVIIDHIIETYLIHYNS